jgi:hypothetical protein
MLDSLKPQDWIIGDELLVLSDTNHDAVAKMLEGTGLPYRHIAEQQGPLGFYGHILRNKYQAEATGTHVCHIDDDDTCEPNMLADMRQAATEHPNNCCLFKYYHCQANVFRWEQQLLQRGMVGTPNILHPNDPQLAGKWRPIYCGDFYFIRDACSKYSEVWVDKVTYKARP